MIYSRAGKTVASAVALLAAMRSGNVRAADARKPPAAVVGQEKQAAKLLVTFDSGLKRLCSVRFTPNGRRLVIEDSYGTQTVWDIQRRQRVAFHAAPRNQPNDAFYSLPAPVLSPNNAARVTVPARSRIVLASRRTGRRRVLSVLDGDVQAVAFTPDSRLLLVAVYRANANGTGEDQNTIRMVRVRDGRLMRVLKAGDYRLDAMAFSHNGALLATRHSRQVNGAEPAHNEDDVEVWDTRSWRVRYGFPTGDDVGWMRFAHDDRTLLVLCSHWTRYTYQLDKFDVVNKQPHISALDALTIYEEGDGSRFASVELSQDGTLLVSTRDGHAKCQDVATGQSIRLYDTPDNAMTGNPDAIALSPDNRLMADVDENGTVTLWQMPALSMWRKGAGK